MATLEQVLNVDDFIQEGANPAPDVFVLACTVGDDYDNPKNRVIVYRRGEILEFGVSGASVLSVDASVGGHAYVLLENGSVVKFDWLHPTTTAELKASRVLMQNPSVEDLGPMRRIRILGDDVLCAGSCSQCYVLHDRSFASLPEVKVGGKWITIEDIAGISRRKFVAVSTDGLATAFENDEWETLDIPTSSGLNRVCALTDGRYAIAGYNGTLIVGRDDTWRIVEPLDSSRNYYGVAQLSDRIYVSYLGGIDFFDGETLQPLAVPQSSKPEFAVLRNGVDGVCSFAGHTVGIVSESGWRTL
jgi:hypothetical protein